MIRSNSLDALCAALSAAQGEFEAVAKSAANPFFKSKYAPLPEVVEAATPILTKHGLAVWQGADTDETGAGEVLWTVVLHKSGQFIGSAARLLPVATKQYDRDGRPLAPTAQDQGSATTYQRRYQYMAALGLVADEDDDGNSASGRSTPARSKPASRKSSAAQTTTQTTTSDGHSDAEDAPQSPLDDESLAAFIKDVKTTDASKSQILAAVKEAGAQNLQSLTSDQATWVLLKLRGNGADAHGAGDD